MQKIKVKTEDQMDITSIVAMGNAVNELIAINEGTQSFHYLIAKLACRWITADDDFRDMVSYDDIQRLATLNEVLHDCHLAVYGEPIEEELDQD
jgi:hypothetical protein